MGALDGELGLGNRPEKVEEAEPALPCPACGGRVQVEGLMTNRCLECGRLITLTEQEARRRAERRGER